MKTWKYILAALAALGVVACGGNTPEPDPVKLTATPNFLLFEAASAYDQYFGGSLVDFHVSEEDIQRFIKSADDLNK